jgi:hypothetical protein
LPIGEEIDVLARTLLVGLDLVCGTDSPAPLTARCSLRGRVDDRDRVASPPCIAVD